MTPDLQKQMLELLDTFVETNVLNQRGHFDLPDFKAGIEEMTGLAAGEIPFDAEDDAAVILRLDQHPFLIRAGIGREAFVWKFGVNRPLRSREIRGR